MPVPPPGSAGGRRLGRQRGAGLLRQALGLWRGPTLAGVQSPWLNAMRDTLEADRLAALADLSDIRLRQGEHGCSG